jgi:hypothetical protein
MMIIAYLILFMLCLPYFGLGTRANTIISVIAAALGLFALVMGWDGGISIRADVD